MTWANVSWRLKAGLAVVLLLVLVRFVLFPLFDWQDETIQKVQILQKAVAQKKALSGNEKEINDLLEQARSSFENTAKLFVKDFSDAQSLQLVMQKEVERLAAASGVQIKRTNWLYPSEGEIVQAPIKINCVTLTHTPVAHQPKRKK